MLKKSLVVVVAVVGGFLNSLESAPIYLKNKSFDPEKMSRETLRIPPISIAPYETKNFLVQFKDTVTEELKRNLGIKNINILSYIPENSLILSLSREQLEYLTSHQKISWVEPYSFAYKVSESITPVSIFDETENILISVRIFQSFEKDKVLDFLKNNGASLQGVFEDVIIVQVEKGLMYRLASLEEVEWIEKYQPPELLNYVMESEEIGSEESQGDYSKLTSYESGSKILRADSIYNLGMTGKTQVVAFADTGLSQGKLDDTLHADLKERILKGYAEGLFSTSWGDSMGHGTHVAGSIAGNGFISQGKIKGMAYDAKLVVQSLTTGFGPMLPPANIQLLFKKSYVDGARVHSNSWGFPGSGGKYENFCADIDKFVWENPDFLPLFAAGNDGADSNKNGVIDESSILAPSVAKNIISVGASENTVSVGGIQGQWGKAREGDKKWAVLPISEDGFSDNENGVAAFSGRGPTADGRLKPDVVAPGTNILSTRSSDPASEKLWGEYDSHYLWSGGTSMATPLTAGATALVRQYYQEVKKLNYISAALLKATILNGAFDMYPGQFGDIAKKEIPNKRPNVQEGWGRVDIDGTLLSQFYHDDATIGVGKGEEASYSMKILSDKPFKITLAYTDYPASPEASKALVNDIDLLVIDPEGHSFYPNRSAGPDRVNNIETVDILKPLVGIYQVKVKGYQVPQGKRGKQPYALVMSGDFQKLSLQKKKIRM